MHFFYLDESGDTGPDLDNADQPITVLGGISLRDEGWNKTQSEFEKLISAYFSGSIPRDFELHGNQLLSPHGEGPFHGQPMADRSALAVQIVDLVVSRKHGIHFLGIDKQAMKAACCGLSLAFNPKRPYLLAFDYMMTYINWYVKEKLGRSARGLVILDEKRQFHGDIENITRDRRFNVTATHRIKWIAEIAYPVDSTKNVMIQMSDLIVLCIRRFLDIEHGHRDGWTHTAINFYAKMYEKIDSRVAKKSIVERGGRHMHRLNKYIEAVRCLPIGRWKTKYDIN
jgi:rubrerythrin